MARGARLALLGTLTGAALLRLLLFALDDVPFIFSDSGAYLLQSDTLVPAYDRPLGYAVFLRPLLDLHESLHTVVYVQTAMGVLMVLGFVWLARRYVLTTTVGLVVFALLAGLDLRTILFERWILTEALSTFVLLPWFACLFRSIDRGAWSAYVGLGATTATLILIRNVFMFLIPFSLLAVAASLPRTGDRRLARRLRAAMLCTVGMLPLLLGYASYFHHHTGRFALTAFDGYSLWWTAGHPSICENRPWSEARGIACRNPYARSDSLADFRAIWQSRGPVRDLRQHYRDDILVNDALRSLALESVRRRPLEYLNHVGRSAAELFTEDVGFAHHLTYQLDSFAARYVRQRFGPDHPSISTTPPTAWIALKGFMRISVVYGVLLLVGTVWAIAAVHRDRLRTILLLWLWAYIAMTGMFGSGNFSRLYVVLTVPLLLFLVATAESIVQRLTTHRVGEG